MPMLSSGARFHRHIAKATLASPSTLPSSLALPAARCIRDALDIDQLKILPSLPRHLNAASGAATSSALAAHIPQSQGMSCAERPPRLGSLEHRSRRTSLRAPPPPTNCAPPPRIPRRSIVILSTADYAYKHRDPKSPAIRSCGHAPKPVRESEAQAQSQSHTAPWIATKVAPARNKVRQTRIPVALGSAARLVTTQPCGRAALWRRENPAESTRALARESAVQQLVHSCHYFLASDCQQSVVRSRPSRVRSHAPRTAQHDAPRSIRPVARRVRWSIDRHHRNA